MAALELRFHVPDHPKNIIFAARYQFVFCKNANIKVFLSFNETFLFFSFAWYPEQSLLCLLAFWLTLYSIS